MKKREKEKERQEKGKRKKETTKTSSPPEQDLHPAWDRFRGTMLRPLICGALAMNGK